MSEKQKEVLHVGIDLGTSRSSISASNGQRHVIESYVGWPLSLVGVKREERGGPRVRAVVGVPAEALRVNKQHVRKALDGAVESLMIVSEPFAVAYGMEALVHSM